MTSIHSRLAVLTVLALGLVSAPPDARAEESGRTTLEMYEVGNLTRPMEMMNEPDDRPPNMEELTLKNAETLVRAIQEFISPALITGSESVKAMGKSTVVALARPEQHQWIRRFLDKQIQDLHAFLLLETRILSVEESEFEALGIGQDPTVLSGPGDAEDFLDRVDHSARANLMSAPKLLINNRQKGTVTVGNQVSYIKGYTVAIVEPDNRAIVSPTIDVIMEGILFEGLVVTLFDDRVGLDFKLTLTEIDRPIETRQTEHGEMGLPIVHTVSINSKMVLRDRATVLFPTRGRETRRTVLMVTIKRVDEEALRTLDQDEDR